jgi:hypothetical protein
MADHAFRPTGHPNDVSKIPSNMPRPGHRTCPWCQIMSAVLDRAMPLALVRGLGPNWCINLAAFDC